MQKDAYRLWSARIVTFVIAALAAASAVYWGLKAWGPDTPSTTPTVMLTQPPGISSQAVARALGGGQVSAQVTPDAAPAPSRYALVGVVAGRSQAGAALISVDGQEARPVRVGSLVDDDIMLKSVSARSAVLSSATENSAKFTLELPPLPQ